MGVDRRVELMTPTVSGAQTRQAAQNLAFGDVSIEIESRQVRAPRGVSTLEPPVFGLLLALAGRPGLTASRGYLIETALGARPGSDQALSQAVAALRHALGDDAHAPRFIETVPRIGYRWIFAAPSPASRWSLGAALAAVVGELRSFVER